MRREHAISAMHDSLASMGAVRTLVQRVRPGTAWYIASEGVNRGGRFVLLLLLARHLGAEGFGPWILAVAVGTVVANAGDFGLATEMTRALAADPARRRIHLQHIWFAATITVCLSGLLIVAAALAFFEDDGRTLLLCAGLGGALEAAAFLLLSPFRASQRLAPESVVRAFQGVTLLGGGAILLSSASAMAVALLFPVVGIVSVAIAAGALVASFGFMQPRIEWAFLRMLIAPALPVFATVLLFFAYFRIDAFLLAGIKGDEAVGIYGVAFNLAYGLAFLPLTFGRAMMPRFAAATDAPSLESSYKGSMAVAAGFGVAISLTLLVLTPAFGRLYATGFDGIRTPYLLLIVAQFLYLMTNMHIGLLFGRSRGNTALALTAGALALNIAMNLVLIPAYGPTGAATTMIVSESALLIVMMMVTRQMVRSAGYAGRDAGAPFEAPELAAAA